MVDEQFIVNVSSFDGFNNSMYSTGFEFDYASALQYVSGLPKVLFWFLLASFVCFLIRITLVKFGWNDERDGLKWFFVFAVDMISFVSLGIGLLFAWLFIFKPTPELIKTCINVGYFLVVLGFGWFGYNLWRDMR